MFRIETPRSVYFSRSCGDSLLCYIYMWVYVNIEYFWRIFEIVKICMAQSKMFWLQKLILSSLEWARTLMASSIMKFLIVMIMLYFMYIMPISIVNFQNYILYFMTNFREIFLSPSKIIYSMTEIVGVL